MLDKVGTWLLTQGWSGIVVLILGWYAWKMYQDDKDRQIAERARDDAHTAQLLTVQKEAHEREAAIQKDAQARIDASQAAVLAAEMRRTADANARGDEMTGFAKGNQAVISQLTEKLREAA